jgi:gamma-glutamyl:cysteine ligase YbdK (ATP-grasp superfamily)
MSEITKEYFEQHLARTMAPLATKQDIREAVEELARITNSGFEDMQQRLDVRERVNKIEAALERKFAKLEEALHIKL